MNSRWSLAFQTPALLGESPFWHPIEQCLYYCDIAAHRLHRFSPSTQQSRHWQFDTDVASCAPLRDGRLMLAMRDGLWVFDPATAHRALCAAPPYDPHTERFNDGKADALGRFWVGTLRDQRDPAAALYRYDGGPSLHRMVGGATVSNGLAWGPDGRILYWSDTAAHTIYSFRVDPSTGHIDRQKKFAQFPSRVPGAALQAYAGRPDGAAVDQAGRYWVAMYEGQRLLCFSPEGRVVADLTLPVRCPTMLCFGGADLKTLYVTTARHNRAADELEAQPWAGCVLTTKVDIPGLPVNFVADREAGT